MSFKQYGERVTEPQREALAEAPSFVATPTWQASATDPDILTRQLPDGWVYEPDEWDDLQTPHVWPAGTLLADDGKLWRNMAGVPLTTRPSEFPGNPGQWAHLFVEVKAEPDEPAEPAAPVWDAKATYKVGDKVTHAGKRWECLLAHGPERQGTWAPGPATPTIWRDLGAA